MTATYVISSTADEALLSTGGYPTSLSPAEYDELHRAISVVGTLWSVEESYDALLQNAVDLETAVARLEVTRRANVSSFPDEIDLEIRLLNRLLVNFLASARAFVNSVKARLSRSVDFDSSKLVVFEAFFSEQFDSDFSYRLMDALRNHTQHQGAAIGQSLTMIRTLRSADGKSMRVLSVSPQIERDDLVNNRKLNADTRKEIAQSCDPMIDLMPHLAAYVRCLGRVVDQARALYQEEYEAALATQFALLREHLADEWTSVWVAPNGDPKRRETLFTGAHELRRLSRIRLRNTARDPV
jgi:hypothetical protein